ncbi:glycoside hydrolase family 16 protein [Ferruginibacter profundus]
MYLSKRNEDFPENVKEKKNYHLEFSDEFKGEELDKTNWLPFYMPFFCAKGLAIPCYEIRKGNLALKITDEQESLLPEFDGELKGSSIQTGIYSGIKEEANGLHANELLNKPLAANQFKNTYTPQYGFFEIRARVLISKSNLVSFRLRGYDQNQKKTGEICIFEIKGNALKGNQVIINYGVQKFHDQKIKEDFFQRSFDIDVSWFHCYAVEWDREKVIFFIDNKKIGQINQSPDYPMQLMLGIFEFPVAEKDIIDRIYPKELIVDYVRGYRRVNDFKEYGSSKAEIKDW